MRHSEAPAAGGAVRYRVFEEADLPAVLRLWEEHSGWGGLTPEKWRKWYVETPHGPSLVTVGVDDAGAVVAQKVFTPAVVRVDEREVRAIRISAPILARRFRHVSIRDKQHPIVGLYDAVVPAAVAAGCRVVYALPEHAWLPFFRWAARQGPPLWHFADSELDCVGVPLADLPLAVDAAARGVELAPATFGTEYAALWESAAASFPIDCAIVRHPAWVEYKNRGHLTFEARDRASGVLLGYAAVKKQTGLLADVLARTPEDLERVIGATARHLARLSADAEGAGGARLDSLKAMDTPALRSALAGLGFAPVDYKFAFVCNTLDPALPREAIAPSRWYLTPGD